MGVLKFGMQRQATMGLLVISRPEPAGPSALSEKAEQPTVSSCSFELGSPGRPASCHIGLCSGSACACVGTGRLGKSRRHTSPVPRQDCQSRFQPACRVLRARARYAAASNTQRRRVPLAVTIRPRRNIPRICHGQSPSGRQTQAWTD